MTEHVDEPAFLDDEGPSDEIPPFICTANAFELHGLRPDEAVAEATIRHCRGESDNVPPSMDVGLLVEGYDSSASSHIGDND